MNLWMLGLVLFVLYAIPGSGWILPWKQELGDLIKTLVPYAPILVGLLILRPVLAGATAGVGGVFGTVSATVRRFLWVILGLPLVVLIMLADTALLGPLAEWMWKYQFALLLLILLSALGIGLAGGTMGREVMIRYFSGAIIAAILAIGWSFWGGGLTNTEILSFTIKQGMVFVDPVRSITVKAGDELVLSVSGQSCTVPVAAVAGGKKARKCFPPFGKFEEVVPYGRDERARGELLLSITDRSGRVTRIPVEITKSGTTTVGLIDVSSFTGGYWMKAKSVIPAKVQGQLGIAFVGLTPDWGKFRVQIQVNPGTSMLGKLAAYKPYLVLLGGLAFAVALFGAVGAINHFVLGGMPWAQKGLNWVAVMFFLASIFAAFQSGVVDTKDLPGLPWWGGAVAAPVAYTRGARFDLPELCPDSNFYRRLEQGEKVDWELGDRPGCNAEHFKVESGEAEVALVYGSGGTVGPLVWSPTTPNFTFKERKVAISLKAVTPVVTYRAFQ